VITALAELLQALDLPADATGDPSRLGEALRQLPLKVPRELVSRMRWGDPDDPVLRQVLPHAREVEPAPGFVPDPLGEGRACRPAGLLRKYRGRALLLVTGECAVHCRYCFRRHLRLAESSAAAAGWDPALAALAADHTVDEVVLSGGDPLTVGDAELGGLVEAIARLPHVRRLRLHTRAPVVTPARVTDRLVGRLTGTRLQPVVVIHCNHPAELDGSVGEALGRLRAAGVTLLNQSVLLAGVNDRLDTLARLGRDLFELGVLPYYLHLLDRVQGAAHFEVSDVAAARLVTHLAGELPGYLVPRLVREVPGATAKVPLPLHP
jgi:EF-P beta-lysylation protein EpmB